MTDLIKAQAGQIHLHLGCANVRLPEFLNMDVRATPATDLVGDAWNLSIFETGSVALIYTRHMIEHLEPEDAVRAFREWYRVLRTDGTAHIICPDLVFHAKQYLGLAESTITNDQHFHAMAGFFGWKIESRGGSRYDAHKWGYSFESLSGALRDAGFSKVERIQIGKDSEPWHLNVKATKL